MTADHDRMEDAVAAYALDACDDEERELVRAHIVACPSCRALARRLSQAVNALPLATDEVRPPDRLRARILAAAAASPQASAEEPPSPRIVPLPTRPAQRQERRLRIRFPAYWAAVAALLVGLLALGAWNVTLNQRLNAPPSRYSLVGTGAMAAASGTVTATQQAAIVSLSGMPELPAGKVYEVWLIDASGKPTPAGTFRPTADGTARVGIDRPLSDVRTVAVTQEEGPAGVDAPTQTPELAGQVG